MKTARLKLDVLLNPFYKGKETKNGKTGTVVPYNPFIKNNKRKMAIETEAKIKLNREEFDKLIKILGKPAFFPQKNTIYKLKEGMFRIREENGKRIITYKGELKKGKFKSLEEVEFKTDSDVDKLKRFFSVLGHKETMFIEKQRANYNYVGCVVSLDILNGNNYFIEIEGKIENIEKCLKKLGLQDKKFEKRSYMEILKHNNT